MPRGERAPNADVGTYVEDDAAPAARDDPGLKYGRFDHGGHAPHVGREPEMHPAHHVRAPAMTGQHVAGLSGEPFQHRELI
jgi:hypothetical protein